jgi:DNA primase
MSFFHKESLELLKQRIDLVEVLTPHLDLNRMGASYKALCPFHDEKTPSFVIQKGDSHYHCFGCGAHGDAIQFLMTHLKMSFVEAVESLAQRFHVPLQRVEVSEEQKGPNKAFLKDALENACQFYQFCLLHMPEGKDALRYLHSRGLDLDFITHFRFGYAPSTPGLFRKIMREKSISDDILMEAGLISLGKTERDFFSDRITVPIHHPSGHVIGFSARKFKEETFGGKYINTPETALFKKSRILFGLNYCRKRIAKERKAIIVEGQIDALRLIQAGFNITVAGQGTAFGEGHVKELLVLGINQIFLALDGDAAGREAAKKIGHFFQKEGVEVRYVQMPLGQDPDSFLREKGSDAFLKLMESSIDYLEFLVNYLSQTINAQTPAGKNELILQVGKLIREWNHPVMVHESLRKLAKLTQVPEEMLGVGQDHLPTVYVKKASYLEGLDIVDPNQVLESDLLRWLLLMGQAASKFVEVAKNNLRHEDFRDPHCLKLYQAYMECVETQRPRDFLSLAIEIEDPETQGLMTQLLQKKVNKDRAEQHFAETIKKILERNWMEKREEIKRKIQSGQCSDEEALALAKQFDLLKQNPPQVKV